MHNSHHAPQQIQYQNISHPISKYYHTWYLIIILITSSYTNNQSYLPQYQHNKIIQNLLLSLYKNYTGLHSEIYWSVETPPRMSSKSSVSSLGKRRLCPKCKQSYTCLQSHLVHCEGVKCTGKKPSHHENNDFTSMTNVDSLAKRSKQFAIQNSMINPSGATRSLCKLSSIPTIQRNTSIQTNLLAPEIYDHHQSSKSVQCEMNMC